MAERRNTPLPASVVPSAPTARPFMKLAIAIAACLLTACSHEAPRSATPATSAPVASLTWTFSRSLGESDGGPERDLDVVLRVGDSVHSVRLGRQHGTLVPSEQSVCDPALKGAGVVSVLALHTMGPKTIVARRVAPALLEISFTVDADDEPAKTHGVLATIHVPAEARVIEQVREVHEDGREAPLACTCEPRDTQTP